MTKSSHLTPPPAQTITEYIDEGSRDPLLSESAHESRRRKVANGHYSEDSDDEDFEDMNTGTPLPRKVCTSLLV